MILTVTLNPSIDTIYHTELLNIGKANKFKNPHRNVGGKGINVARVLNTLNEDVCLTGFLGGDNRLQIMRMLSEESIGHYYFLEADGSTRLSTTIMHENNKHTELNEEGLELYLNDLETIVDEIVRITNKYEIEYINISGSVNAFKSAYEHLSREIRRRNIEAPILFDISGKHLKHLLLSEEPVFFIKPNEHEIGELLGLNAYSKELILNYLTDEVFDNVENLLVSFGKDGALFRKGKDIYDITIPEVEIVNTTGSGDSTVAGFTYGLTNNLSIEKSLKFAMACGISNAMNIGTGDICMKQIQNLIPQIKVTLLT